MLPVKPAATSSFRSSVAVLIDSAVAGAVGVDAVDRGRRRRCPRRGCPAPTAVGKRAGRYVPVPSLDDLQIDEGVRAVRRRRELQRRAVGGGADAGGVAHQVDRATNSVMLGAGLEAEHFRAVGAGQLEHHVVADAAARGRRRRRCWPRPEPFASRRCSCRRPWWSPATAL